MAKKAPTANESPAADAAPSTALRYIGPVGQTSPLFGELVPGRTYTADATFAAYLAEKHPDYWQRAAKE